jgi:hypothetical protein
MRMAKNMVSMGEYKFRHGFGGKTPERKRKFGRPTLRLDDNIKVDLKKISWENVDWFSQPRTGTWSGRF